MTPELLRRRFREIGAPLVVADLGQDGRPFFRIGLTRTHRLERFSAEMAGSALSIDVPDLDAGRRLLLLRASWPDPFGREIDNRYLCGFDERHWFTAAIPESSDVQATTVTAAQEALKPQAARLSQSAHRVPARLLNERDNPGFIRQGEWFFVPRPEVSFDIRRVRRNAALQRGYFGQPHVVQYLVGDSEPDSWRGWRPRESRQPLYARGTVRHRDHRTIRLPFWHEVELSLEAGATVDFD